jgi:hypothetical protein
MGSIPPFRGIDKRVLYRIAAADARWFEEHPAALGRVRPLVPGEGPKLHLVLRWVAVLAVEPGFRIRMPLPDRYGWPDERFDLDDATGEILAILTPEERHD